jgi:hypothetical protein
LDFNIKILIFKENIMKTLQKLVLAFGLVGLLYSCQSTNQVLSKSEKRTEIMKTIADDQIMSKEMMAGVDEQQKR